MQIIHHDSPAEFHARVLPFLAQNEAANNLQFGVLGWILKHQPGTPAVPSERPLLVTVEDADQVVAVAIMLPPHRMILTAAPTEALQLLATDLAARHISLLGCLGPPEAASFFADAFTRLVGQKAEVRDGLRIYRLDATTCTPVSRPVPGRMVVARFDQIDALTAWFEAFRRDAHSDATNSARQVIAEAVHDGQLFVWNVPSAAAETPVAMAAALGPTPHGIRIAAVYTPPEHRRHGYASALVAALSRHMLDSGRQFCFLFTDLANPTSNHIYQEVGYRPVADNQSFTFR